jgi:hypothetical protein
MNGPLRAIESSSLTNEHSQPSRGRLEPLWEVCESDQHTWSARLHYHGEWGVEAQFLRDGKLVMGHRFGTKQEAVAWAAEFLTNLRMGSTK